MTNWIDIYNVGSRIIYINDLTVNVENKYNDGCLFSDEFGQN